MYRRRILDAIRFPALLLAWTAGVVLATLQLEEADVLAAPFAAGEPVPVAATVVDLPAPPSLADADAWSAAIAQLARQSEVMNGSWQPAPVRAVPRIHPVARVAPPVEPSPAVARVVKQTPVEIDRFSADKSRAREALRGGRFTEAYGLLRPRVGEARQDSEYLGLLALAAMRLGSHGEAMVLYQRLAALEPGSGRWRMGLALAQEGLGLDASSEYRQALALAEDPDGMRTLLAGRLAAGDVT